MGIMEGRCTYFPNRTFIRFVRIVIFTGGTGSIHWVIFRHIGKVSFAAANNSLHVPIRFQGTRGSYLVIYVLFYSTYCRLPCRNFYGVCIKVIQAGFTQQEDIFVRFGATVLNTLRHRIRFAPNNILTQIPTVCPKCKCKQPRNTYQIFRVAVCALLY